MTNNMLWGLLLILMMEILPVLYLAVGLALLRRPPKLGKGFFSYRNFVSKKDEAHWQFAQKCFGRLLTKTMPILMIAAALTCMALLRFSDSSAASMAGMIALLAEFISVFVCQTITAHKLEAQFHDMRDAMKDED